ncbi:MAG: hypothetical protein AAGE01_16520 [Pseudomonadota bacterium]
MKRVGHWLVVAMLFWSAGAVAQTLTLSPNQGDPGDLIDAEAAGLAAGVAYTLQLDIGAADAVVIQSPIAPDRTGGFITEFNVPAVGDGDYTMQLIENATGALAASAPFTVGELASDPTLALRPGSGQPGDPITVAATGLGSSVTYTLQLSRSGIRPVTVLSSIGAADGAIDTAFDVPNVAAGSYTAELLSDRGRTLVASTPFTVEEAAGEGTLTLEPDSGEPGDSIDATATNLSNDFTYRLQLSASGTNPTIVRSSIPAPGGAIDTPFNVPDIAAGAYTMELILEANGKLSATAPFTVEDPSDGGEPTQLIVDASPGTAFGGGEITLTVENLVPGTVVAFAEGLMVAGPIGVTDPLANLDLLLPEGLPGTVTITVENRIGGVAVGEGSTQVSRVERATTAIRIPQVEVTRGEGLLGGLDIEGRLELPDDLDPQDFLAAAEIALCGEGFFAPLPFGSATAAPNGAFAITGVLFNNPSFGTYPLPQSGPTDEYGFVYTDPDTGETDCYRFEADDTLNVDPPRLQLRVVDVAGNGIQDVRVSVVRADAPFLSAPGGKRRKGSLPAEATLFAPVNPDIAGVFLDLPSFSILDDRINETCPEALTVYRTDSEGRVRDQNGDLGIGVREVVEISPWLQAFIDPKTGKIIKPPVEEQPPELLFSVKINALPQGFGFVNANGFGAPSRFVVGFTDETINIYDAVGEPVDFDPEIEVQVTLPGYNGPSRFLTNPVIEGLLPESFDVLVSAPFLPLSIPLQERGGKGTALLQAVGPVYEERQGWQTLFTYPQPPQRGGKGAGFLVPVSTVGDDDEDDVLIIKQPYDAVLRPELVNSPPSVRIKDPQGRIIVEKTVFGGGDVCDGKLEAFTARIREFEDPNGQMQPIYRLPAGDYAVDFVAEPATGPISSSTALRVAEADPWFMNEALYDPGNGQSPVDVNWSPSRIDIRVIEPTQAKDASSNNQGLQRVGIGQLENDNLSAATVEGSLLSTGAESRMRYAATSSQFSGNAEGTMEQQSLPTEGPVGVERKFVSPCASGDDFCIQIGEEEPRTLINTGKIPLFRYAWGIPPIAAATLGADFWFLLTLKLFGTFTAVPEPELNLLVQPKVNAGIDIFFDLSILFGLASARVDVSPNIAVAMPVKIVQNNPEAGVCFNFDLDLRYRVALGFCELCVKAEDEFNLFRIEEGNGCPIIEKGLFQDPFLDQFDPPVGRTDIASNGQGVTLGVWDSIFGIVTDHSDDGILVLGSGAGAMRPAVAFIDADTAVVVWSQTSLSDTQFQNLDDEDVSSGLDNFHLAYAVYDQGSFGPVQNLTLPQDSFGDGGVELAACRAGDTGCPAGGEVMAIWERDDSGDYEMHDYSVHYAYFDGNSWTAPQPIDATSTIKQVQPTATYLDGEPVAMWIENPGITASKSGDGVNLDLMQRFMRYRFLDLGPAQDAAGLPLGVASPSIAGENGTLMATFTVGSTFAAKNEDDRYEDVLAAFGKAPGEPTGIDPSIGYDPGLLPFATPPNDAFLGGRRALHVAETTGCTAGVCTWSGAMQTDEQGRALYGERPQLLLNGSGTPAVVFRYFGNSNVQDTDPIGVVLGSGDLARIPINGVGVPAMVTALTNDGQINWQNSAIYDGFANQIITLGAIGPDLDRNVLNQIGKRAPKSVPGVVRKGVDPDRGIEMKMASLAPDLVVVDVSGLPDRLVPGSSFDADVLVANRGGDAQGSALLTTTFDSPFGIGIVGDERQVSVPDPGMTELRRVRVHVPEDFFEDEARTLVFQVNADGIVDESDGTNNRFEAVVGALPRPFALVASASDQGTFVELQWHAEEDDRVSGYLVYRENPDGSEILLARTPVKAYADVRAGSEFTYRYRVVSTSDRMVKSRPSDWIRIRVPRLDLGGPFGSDTIFTDGFEAR